MGQARVRLERSGNLAGVEQMRSDMAKVANALGRDLQFAILYIDENGIARADVELPTHGYRDDELATIHDLDPLCFHGTNLFF